MFKKEELENGTLYLEYDGNGKDIKEVIKDLEDNMNKEEYFEFLQLSLVYNKLSDELSVLITVE